MRVLLARKLSEGAHKIHPAQCVLRSERYQCRMRAYLDIVNYRNKMSILHVIKAAHKTMLKCKRFNSAQRGSNKTDDFIGRFGCVRRSGKELAREREKKLLSFGRKKLVSVNITLRVAVKCFQRNLPSNQTKENHWPQHTNVNGPFGVCRLITAGLQ